MDLITLALAKKYSDKINAGVKKVEVVGNKINFTLKDGTVSTMTVPAPKDGVSLTNVTLNAQNEVICTLSDGSSFSAGTINIPKQEVPQQPEIDLTPYVKNTQYSSIGTAGVIFSGYNSFIVSQNGVPYCTSMNENSYNLAYDTAFISKGTLAALLNRQNYVKHTETASSSKAGIVRPLGAAYGLNVYDGSMSIAAATTAEIDAKTNNYKPITPANLAYAVHSVSPIVDVTIPDKLKVNTIYDIAVTPNLKLNLPEGKIGDTIRVDFISGATPTNLVINCAYGITDMDLIPQEETAYTLTFKWGKLLSGSYGWRASYEAYTE